MALWRFGALALYDMDGAPTERSQASAQIAGWINAPAQSELRAARPVRGEIGILVAPETQIFSTLQNGNSDFYANAARGAYRAFLDSNIQADFASPAQLDRYELIYLPHPLMLGDETARLLTDWVKRGGALVSEGAPGYFGERGRAGTRQPNLGLDALFGAAQSAIEFTPDLLGNLTFAVGEQSDLRGGVLRQDYRVTTGVVAGHYEDGGVAVVDNAFGAGRTRLIGTCAGAGYWTHSDAPTRAFLASLLSWAGCGPRLRCSDNRVKARLHQSENATFLWLINPEREPVRAQISFAAPRGNGEPRVLWGEGWESASASQVTATVAPRDALVLQLT